MSVTWKLIKQRLFYFVYSILWIFLVNIIKLTIHTAIGTELKSISSLQRASDARQVECDGQPAVSTVWDDLFSWAPIEVSLFKAASSLNVYMIFFSQRFSSLCSCRVVGYCSMKLNNNCNCTFFPKDFKYWKYSLNAFILTCPWPLVHLSRARNNLKRDNFSLWTFRGHVG